MLKAEMLHQCAVQMFEVFLPGYKNVYTVIRPVISTQTDYTLQNEWTAQNPPIFHQVQSDFLILGYAKINSFPNNTEPLLRVAKRLWGGEIDSDGAHVIYSLCSFLFHFCKMR